MTSIEPPIQNLVDGEPVYQKKATWYEQQRNKFYQYVSKGELQFTIDILNVFGQEYLPELSAQTAVRWINFFLQNMNDQDEKYLRQVYFAADSAHVEYAPMIR